MLPVPTDSGPLGLSRPKPAGENSRLGVAYNNKYIVAIGCKIYAGMVRRPWHTAEMASQLSMRHYQQNIFCKDRVHTACTWKLLYTYTCMHAETVLQDPGNRNFENIVLPCERTMCSGAAGEFELDWWFV